MDKNSIYIWGANKIGEEIKNCVNTEKNDFVGFIDNSYKLQGKKISGKMIYSFNEVKYSSNIYIIISIVSTRYKEVYDQILAQGYKDWQITCFFDISDPDRYVSDVFISEEMCQRVYQDVLVGLENENKKKKIQGLWYDIEKELEDMRSHPDSKKIYVIGKNEYSDYFIKKLEEIPVTFCKRLYFDNNNDIQVNIEELLCENLANSQIYIIAPLRTRKIEGYLLEMGITCFKSLCETHSAGTRLQDVYDLNLGYTWIEDGIPGFIRFTKETKPDWVTFRILTLGGSTTDATLVNIKSWSEYIFEMCNGMEGYNIEVYAGGMASYTSTQEMRKLIRDVLEISPNLVLSYSGVNDALSDDYYQPEYPMCLKYEVDNIKSYIQEGHIFNTLMNMSPIEKYTLGLKSGSNLAQHWIKCERIMHTICKEFGIKFYGFLQPYNYNNGISFVSFEKMMKAQGFFDEVRENLANVPDNDYLIDFTQIFKGEENVFFDFCHVYEKGNRIIARKIMPYILKSIGG